MTTSLHFSPEFDQTLLADLPANPAGSAFLGEKKLLDWIEKQLGLSGYPSNTDYLRIELYRQALSQQVLESDGREVFYLQSFENDRFATASALLEWRDELLLAGWDFSASNDCPPRLHCLAEVEKLFQRKIQEPEFLRNAWGFADRFEQVMKALASRKPELDALILYVPLGLQRPHIVRLVEALRTHGVEIREAETQAEANPDSELGYLQRKLLGQAVSDPQASDKEQIFLLRTRRDSDAASFLAQLLRENSDWRPAFLIPNLNLLLEHALQHEGHPAMGIASSSLARPSLQVLKLAPTFLWEPVDVYKLMEFLTLSVKPLDSGLSVEIARVLADKPGLFNNNWFAAVYGYLESGELPDEVREQYEFWFARKRYPLDRTAPKKDATELYAYLETWGRKYFEESGSSNPTLLVLAEQARRIREILDALPEPRIGFLELERIVRTIYQPSPVQITDAEVQRFDYAHQPGAILKPVDALIWWNCSFDGQMAQPDKWQAAERAYLNKNGVKLYEKSQERRWQQASGIRPVLKAKQRLILMLPEQIDGAEALPSLLLGDIEAALGSARFKAIQYDIDRESERQRLARSFKQATGSNIAQRNSQRVRPHLILHSEAVVPESEYETPTNLENLFYYPHRWFFKQKLRFYAGGMLSISRENTLLGSLAHRFFEELLKIPDLKNLDKNGVRDWIMEQSNQLLPREGAPLLLYGREPERLAFLHKVQNAAWALISILRNNGWEVLHTELDLEGHFLKMPIRGKADLVLQREKELAIVDLKWGGAKRRKELIQNSEDLQLVLYAKLLPPPDYWPHTAYFILDDAKIIARNNAAFKEAVVAGKFDEHGAACQAIYDKMEKTYQWRLDQVQKGQIELRNKRTLIELEHLYEGQLMDLLEMKSEEAKWDEFRGLFDIV